ncbi:TSF1 [Auxenochlorella protothecoides x Auxenochlorella symbiontica]
MPVVSVNRDRLFEALGQVYSDEEFDKLCFEYGIELDDVTSEKEMLRKEQAIKADSAALAEASEEVIYKIDIPANRYDMLCLEGIARALNIFRERLPAPTYTLANNGVPTERLTIRPATALVRPFAVAAILRGVTLDAARYASFIDLQDKLHQNLCRQRTLVSIGTHNLGVIQGPFTYEAHPPQTIRFVPLKQTREFAADELMQHYLANDQKLKKFVPIIQSSLVYPAVYDANRVLLSLPPIINGEHSKILIDAKTPQDILIEVTATDLTKANVVLNTVCAMFSEYCAVPYEIEPVEVVDAFGKSTVTPDVSPREMQVELAYIRSTTGLTLDAEQASAYLRRMQLEVRALPGGQALGIRVPVTRSDILHPCDVVEDVAIAHGYNNLRITQPSDATTGRELPLNALCELLRGDVAAAGWTEILTWALCSREENFGALRRSDGAGGAVTIGNPATAEFEVVRTSLLPGALKTIGANRDAPLPIKLFEVSDVVLPSDSAACGAVNRRRLVAVHCDKTSGFEVTHGLLNRVMESLRVPLVARLAGEEGERARAAYGGGYEWKAEDDATFFPGRCAAVYAKGERVGQFGIVHPQVLAAFDIAFPVSALELDLEPFCFDQMYRPLSCAPAS